MELTSRWDALGPATEKVKDEDDTSGVKTEDDEEQTEGRIWRLQAHARNSITAMKVDPVNGSGVSASLRQLTCGTDYQLFSSSYDCTLRHLDFSTLKSTELFAHSNDDMLITHFDLMPTGQQAWLADKNGGISLCDFREGQQERKRWVVQEEGRASKLGGLSVNRQSIHTAARRVADLVALQPHLLVTAGNDQHLRIWDTRHFSRLNPRSTEVMTPAPSSPGEDIKPRINTYPTSSIENEKISNYQSSTKGKGLLRASYQHGKSCSAAYWDPWGRRILTTSYDDTLRSGFYTIALGLS
jgi:WD40 repeat protein